MSTLDLIDRNSCFTSSSQIISISSSIGSLLARSICLRSSHSSLAVVGGDQDPLRSLVCEKQCTSAEPSASPVPALASFQQPLAHQLLWRLPLVRSSVDLTVSWPAPHLPRLFWLVYGVQFHPESAETLLHIRLNLQSMHFQLEVPL